MKKILILLFVLIGVFTSSPWLNPYLVEYDLMLVPKNFLRGRSPIIRSISDLKVFFQKGEANYLRNDVAYKLEKDSILIPGDYIYVKDNGWLVLEFAFGSKLKVNANTIIRVADLKKTQNFYDHQKINTFIIETGSFYVDYVASSSQTSLIIQSKRGKIHVKGTDFIAAMGFEDQALRVAVNHGEVDLTNADNKSVDVDGGEGAVVYSNGKFQEPENHKWVQNIDWDLEEQSSSSPESYDTLIQAKLNELKQDKDKLMEQVKTFVPDSNAVTNDNLDEKLKEAAKEEGPSQNTEVKTVKNPTKDHVDYDVVDEEDLKELDLNFSRYNKNFVPKINQELLAQFSEKGLMPNDLEVARLTIQKVEGKNSDRLKMLDEIDE